MIDFDVDIYVTGLNSRMMSSEISTYLTGRYVSFRIFPLSFEEYLAFRKEYTFSNVGQTFSTAALSKYLKSQNRKIDPETVYSYVNKLETAYILHRCSRYDIKGKEMLKTREKFYLADPAFRFSVLGYDENAVASMLENLVYMEFVRRGYDVYVGKLDNAEVDFVATKKEEKIYVQISERIEKAETERCEYGKLLSIADTYPKYVLRTDEFAGGNYEGIKTMHVADFLLSQEY